MPPKKKFLKSVIVDDKFKETFLQWDEECEDLSCDESEFSDQESDFVNKYFKNEESEASSSDESDMGGVDVNHFLEVIGSSSHASYVAPSGLTWETEPPETNKLQNHSFIQQIPAPEKKYKSTTPKETFKLFITDAIVEEIVNCTNLEGKRAHEGKKSQWKEVNSQELHAFFGLLIQAGVDRSWDVPVRELFSNEFANPIYRATMTIQRFEEIKRFLSFDDKSTREFRLQSDKLAMISHVWNLFTVQCKACLIPHKNVTIDEQLVPCMGSCKFVQCTSSKPTKHGLKIYWICESNSGYAIDGLVYIGRQPDETVHKNFGVDVVKALVRSILNSGLNLTISNFFTSVSLAHQMLENNITTVGTLRSGNRDIPKEMNLSRERTKNSSLFCFSDNITMVSYVPKKGSCIILLSTMHHNKAINNDAKKKPDILAYYNKTKGGVDLLNQMISTYSCKRQTKRWPMAFFLNMIDVAAVNAYVIFSKENETYHQGVSHKRRLFLKELAGELVLSHMQMRSASALLRRTVVESMGRFINVAGPSTQQESHIIKRRRCSLCPSNLDRKSKTICENCKKNVCKKHSVTVCVTCMP